MYNFAMNKNTLTVIGMMSGTSLDGIDACLVEIDENFGFKILNSHSLVYPEQVREKLLMTANNNASTKDVCYLDFVVGKLFAQCANELVSKSGLKSSQIDLISSHGQTVYHMPVEETIGGISSSSTLQIGNISVISELTGIKTVGDFRSKDMAAGGQGAPLVPFADELIFKKDIPRAIQNIGGISNVTILSNECETFAFDTGVGNMLIDFYMQRFFDKPFDKDGEIALSGNIDEVWLEELLKESYYKKLPPKSTGRELFNSEYALRILDNAPADKRDLISTITALTTRTIANAYKSFVFPKTKITELVVGGGGAYNKAILRFLEKEMPFIRIRTHKDFGIEDKLKEALAFAMLGVCTIRGIPNNIPSCTGATKRVIMGTISN